MKPGVVQGVLVGGWRVPAAAAADVVGQVGEEELQEHQTLEPCYVSPVEDGIEVGSGNRCPSCWVGVVGVWAGAGLGRVGVDGRADLYQGFYGEVALA